MRLAWDKQQGLLPAIVQHATSGAVLMLGYMNREALRATLERGRVVFYSRRGSGCGKRARPRATACVSPQSTATATPTRCC